MHYADPSLAVRFPQEQIREWAEGSLMPKQIVQKCKRWKPERKTNDRYLIIEGSLFAALLDIQDNPAEIYPNFLGQYKFGQIKASLFNSDIVFIAPGLQYIAWPIGPLKCLKKLSSFESLSKSRWLLFE